MPPEPEIRSDGFVENKVDFCENLSQSAEACSWDLEDSFDDTEELEDSDPPENLSVDEEDQPVKVKRPRNKIEKVTLNLEALPTEMQEQALLEKRLHLKSRDNTNTAQEQDVTPCSQKTDDSGIAV